MNLENVSTCSEFWFRISSTSVMPPSSLTSLQYFSGVTVVRLASAQTAHIWHCGVWETPAKAMIGAKDR